MYIQVTDQKNRHLKQTSVNLYVDQLEAADEAEVNLSELFRDYLDERIAEGSLTRAGDTDE